VNTASHPFTNLFTVTAALESGVGLLLVAVPSFVSRLLLGSSLEGPLGATVARIAGGALLALAIACWMARSDVESRAAKGVASAMVLYNAAVATILAYAGMGLGLSSIGIWPVVLLHVGMAVWCVLSLKRAG